MPKAKGRGGKNRKKGKGVNIKVKRELEFKEEGQEYCQILKMLGNGRVEAMCSDGQKRLCHIRGKMRKKVWIQGGDVCLISLREFQPEKGDILLKYNPDEVRNLKAYGEINFDIQLVEENAQNAQQEGGDVEFIDSDDDEKDQEEIKNEDTTKKLVTSYNNARDLPPSDSDEYEDDDDDEDDDDEDDEDEDEVPQSKYNQNSKKPGKTIKDLSDI